MKYSNAFIYTKKEASSISDSISHQLCIKAGLIHQVVSGIYSITPIGQRVINNIINVIKVELNSGGCLEVSLPLSQPLSLWKESGRLDIYGEEMIKFKTRDDKSYCFGPTHEEVICDLVRANIKSYKDLPFNLYQIGRKFRDELRPQNGLIRTKEFTMKDGYSFHTDQQSLDNEYEKIKQCYLTIFSLLNLKVKVVEASSGEIGGGYSEEFITTEGIEVAHIFKLGDKYTRALNVTYQGSNNKLDYPLMGCYGIGITRLLPAIIEQNHDDRGIIFPKNIAPFINYVIPIGTSNELIEEVDYFYKYNMHSSNTLVDDRNVSIGVKLKDADLLGIPNKIIFNDKTGVVVKETISR